MGAAAVPAYVKGSDKTIPPGHRFGLYFPIWNKETWKVADKEKTQALSFVLEIDRCTRDQSQALLARQRHIASSFGEVVLAIPAKSTAPFMTGIGMEHPLENGFAVLNPYGLPYLPGASAKGVLRKAAEDLALGRYGDSCGWSFIDVWWLFGFEANSAYLVGGKDEKIQVLREKAEALKDAYVDWAGKMKVAEVGPLLDPLITQACADNEEIRGYRSDPALFLKDLAVKKQMREAIHNRGALVFWDVFPEVAGDKLWIDILTPHFSNYYKGESPPSDCGQPTPNPFLTVPPDSSFEFHVQYSPVDALKSCYDKRWKELVRAAFQHALDWMGFGAKTSVGYGQMRLKESRVEIPKSLETIGKEKHQAELSRMETWENALLTWSPGDGKITAIAGGKKATTKDRAIIPESIAKKLFGKKKTAQVHKVEVEPLGNAFGIIKILD